MTDKVKVALCWHMHQPYYRDGLDGSYHLPWVYLHAIKDYADMAAHLESFPTARVVVNFAPVLLEQLDDYAHQMRQWLQHETPMHDPLLNLLAGETELPASANHDRSSCAVSRSGEYCFRANHDRSSCAVSRSGGYCFRAIQRRRVRYPSR